MIYSVLQNTKKLKLVKLRLLLWLCEGRTLKNSFAILDEAQIQQQQNKNVSNKNRENSKLVVNGDPSQIDLINKSQSGLISSKRF